MMFVLFALFALLPGCTPLDATGRFDSSDTATGSDDTADDSDTMSADSGVLPPAWYTVGATASLSGGLLTALTVTYSILPETPSDGLICESLRAPISAVDVPSPDPTIYHWWLVELPGDDGACEGAEVLPTTLLLGLGALHADIVAGLKDDAEQAAAGSLYGAYVATDGVQEDGQAESIYVYGYAGTPADLAGETIPVAAPPAPDGDYTLTPVYVLKLPGDGA
jgi:hypothetical protein